MERFGDTETIKVKTNAPGGGIMKRKSVEKGTKRNTTKPARRFPKAGERNT
jgi:hypothetical protein